MNQDIPMKEKEKILSKYGLRYQRVLVRKDEGKVLETLVSLGYS